MSVLAETSSLLETLDAIAATRSAEPPALARLRQLGRVRFEKVGIPKTNQEDWRFTNLGPLERETFLPPQRAAVGAAGAAQVEPFRIAETRDLIFIDGFFQPELSNLPALPAGVFVGSLAEALSTQSEAVIAELGRHADLDHAFVALNSAAFADGAFIHVPRGVKLPETLHLLFLSTGKTASFPRILIVAEESAELTLIESFSSLSGARSFCCPVTEIVGKANSVIDHYRLGQESYDAFHLAMLKIRLERDANFFSHSICHGGAIVRNDIQAFLGGEGINCTLNGLYLTRGKQLVDHHMLVDHAFPNCHSYELFKGVLEDESRTIFNGKIYVHQRAQKTDAKQSNRNLLLSDRAHCHSNPQLEIFADDVRCTHGSTTGHLDDEAVFYLRSRGIGEDAAKSLLTYAFANEVLNEIRLERVRRDAEEFLFTRLPKGDVVRQAV